jgi:hypothetical protein
MDDQDVDEEWAREKAEDEADRLRKAESAPVLSTDEFLTWRSPRQTGLNPTRLNNPLWQWLVRTRWSAYSANNIYKGPSSFDAGPMWTFERFGMSETRLPDGRVIHIGGEHEDSYDPDFFIYNDAIIVCPDGEIAIYGYPVDEFQPTDFHTATRVNESIVVIGGLGYPERRVAGTTPVYRLSINTMSIERVETRGESPGWIYKHTATLGADGQTIIVSGGELWTGNDRPSVENIDSWTLNTQTGEWARLTERKWQRWTIRRLDQKPCRLWHLRQARWSRDHADLGMDNGWIFAEAPDFDALEMLYRLDEETPPPTAGKEFNVVTVVIDSLLVRFTEHRFWIEAIVEGQLIQARLDALQRKTLAMIERVEAAPCKLEKLPDSNFEI